MRQLGMFLADPLNVPPELVDYLAEQLGIEDSLCVKRYTEREKSKPKHAWGPGRNGAKNNTSGVAAGQG